MRLITVLSLAAIAISGAGTAAHAADPVPEIAQCGVSVTADGGDGNLAICTYIPISTAATLWVSGSGTGKSAWVDCLTTSSPHISSGATRISQTPGDLCTLHVYVFSGFASGSADSRL